VIVQFAAAIDFNFSKFKADGWKKTFTVSKSRP